MLESNRKRALVTTAAIATALCSLALAGCVDGAFPGATPTSSPAATTSPAPTPSATTTPSPSAAPTATSAPAEPIGIGCDALLPPEAVYDLGMNLLAAGSAAPEAGSPSEAAVDSGGVACLLVHESSDSRVVVAASSPGSEAVAAAKAAAGAPFDLGRPGVEGFARDGVVEAFVGEYRVSAESSFFGPDALGQILAVALDALG